MHLKSLKLAGFKSFVDPVVIPFPSNLVGIVGPNGCGKSNIVDSIRFVIGGTPAKQLRGESMADVIFNGSSVRKPIGQAMVELVFDNSAGTIGGEYAQYSEIAIKRQINRDGQSDYLVNGIKCRRQDIINIFLGTGLGPNSYSIIEQGMISRFIEAKPDDLRMYLEEAAGISKYKERRRETEHRIKRTRENLERLHDLRQAGAKQLETLNRQASAAVRYKLLKEEQRMLRARCLALYWRQLDTQWREQSSLIQAITAKIDIKIIAQQQLVAELEKQRNEQVEANAELNEMQAHYYNLSTEVARLEQTIIHQRERLVQVQSDQAQIKASWQKLQNQLGLEQHSIEQITQELTALTPALASAQSDEIASYDVLGNAERAMEAWQSQWELFNHIAAETTQKTQVEQTRIHYLEQQINSAGKRSTWIQAEQAQIDFIKLDKDSIELNNQYEAWQTKINQQQSLLAELVARLNSQRDMLEKVTQSLDESRNRVQTARGRNASLQALQQAALGHGSGSAKQWLQAQQLSTQARLAQKLTVASGWELAVETVLGPYLEAVCVEDSTQFVKKFGGLNAGEIILLDVQSKPLNCMLATHLLATHVYSDYAVQSLLTHIYCAEDIDAALAMRPHLEDAASVVTRDGIWLGKYWLRVNHTQDNSNSIIKRATELSELSQQLQKDEQCTKVLTAEVHVYKQQLVELEVKRDTLQHELNQARDQANKIITQVAVQGVNRERLAQRTQQLQHEQQEQQALVRQCHGELSATRSQWQAAIAAREQDEQRRRRLSVKHTSLRAALETARDSYRNDKDQGHQLNLRSANLRAQLSAFQENVERLQQQLQGLQARRLQLQAAIEAPGLSIESLAQNLQTKLETQAQEESQLKVARCQLTQLTENVAELEKNRNELTQAIQALRSQLQTLQLDLQTYVVRRTSYEEQIMALRYQLENILSQLPLDITPEKVETELQSISHRIERLGAINLLAIEEAVVEAERGKYLDAQFTDLNQALATLENVIRKIDHETKSRFQDTFDRVNNRFQELFARIFAGGSAYLALTGEDILDKGVVIMAQPPGKRNSSIHLLSGGEKALIAVSLIFAMFQLNPAPFCLLDEVDAPLDDANVARFCNLVREMSSQVQFMFISHNKLTIEMAEHLTGVTMRESGVSHIVAVSVKEAVELAAA